MKDATNIKSVKSSNQCQSVILTSYDILWALGGEIKMESVQGEGSEFIIHIPIIVDKTEKP